MCRFLTYSVWHNSYLWCKLHREWFLFWGLNKVLIIYLRSSLHAGWQMRKTVNWLKLGQTVCLVLDRRKLNHRRIRRYESSMIIRQKRAVAIKLPAASGNRSVFDNFPPDEIVTARLKRVDEVRLITLTLFTVFFTSTSGDSEHRQEVFSFCSVVWTQLFYFCFSHTGWTFTGSALKHWYPVLAHHTIPGQQEN